MEKKNYCEWKFYAINQENKLVLGFSDEDDAKQYCKKYKFRTFTRNGLKNKKINPNDLNNWVYDNETPEFKIKSRKTA